MQPNTFQVPLPFFTNPNDAIAANDSVNLNVLKRAKSNEPEVDSTAAIQPKRNKLSATAIADRLSQRQNSATDQPIDMRQSLIVPNHPVTIFQGSNSIPQNVTHTLEMMKFEIVTLRAQLGCERTINKQLKTTTVAQVTQRLTEEKDAIKGVLMCSEMQRQLLEQQLENLSCIQSMTHPLVTVLKKNVQTAIVSWLQLTFDCTLKGLFQNTNNVFNDCKNGEQFENETWRARAEKNINCWSKFETLLSYLESMIPNPSGMQTENLLSKFVNFNSALFSLPQKPTINPKTVLSTLLNCIQNVKTYMQKLQQCCESNSKLCVCGKACFIRSFDAEQYAELLRKAITEAHKGIIMVLQRATKINCSTINPNVPPPIQTSPAPPAFSLSIDTLLNMAMNKVVLPNQE